MPTYLYKVRVHFIYSVHKLIILQPMHPTEELYHSLQTAFEHFNAALFNGKLEKVIFTVQRQKGVMGYFAPDRWGNLKGRKCHEIAINPSYIANARLIEVMQTLVHEMVHCWQHCFGRPGRAYYHNKEWANKMMEVGLMPSSTGEPGGKTTGQHMGDYIIKGGLFLIAFNDLQSNKRFQLRWIDRKSLPRLFEPIVADPNEESSIAVSKDALVAVNPELTDIDESMLMPHVIENSECAYSELMPDNFVVEQPPKRKTRTRYICSGCDSKVYGKANLNIRCEDCNRIFER